MFVPRSVIASVGALAVGAALVAVPAHAEPLTCQGLAVTVAGNTGTPGDDVMVIDHRIPGPADTGAGNDIVCIRATAETEPFSSILRTGPGNDSVVNETTNGGSKAQVILGSGSDTYLGSDEFGETVIAGDGEYWGWTRLGDGRDTERDVIDTRGGPDTVYSGSATPGATNPDSVTTGAGEDTVHWAGEATGGPLALWGGQNRLYLYPGWQGASAVVDAPGHRVSVDGRAVLTWTGEVQSFKLTLDTPGITFDGTDADEWLTISSGNDFQPSSYRRYDLTLGGGDDTVELLAFGEGRLDGGAGHDVLNPGECSRALVDMERHYTCSQLSSVGTWVDHRAVLGGWESLTVAAGWSADVVGTSGDDEITVRANTVKLRGRAGDDRLVVGVSGKSATSVVRGGAGADDLVGSPGADRLLGERGADRLWGLRGADKLVGGLGRDTLRGGRGPDKLWGGPGPDTLHGGRGPDKLWGGPGLDWAFGGKGFDTCRAERHRSCERS